MILVKEELYVIIPGGIIPVRMVIQLELLGLMEIEVLIGDHNLLKIMLLYRAFLFFEVEIALYKVYFYQYSILSSFSIHSSKALDCFVVE